MMKRVVYWFSVGGLVLVMGLSLGSILLEKHLVVAHLLVHFQLQYFVVVVFFSLCLLLLRKWLLVVVGLVFAIGLYVLMIHPVQLMSEPIERVDVFYINSHYSNDKVGPIIQAIEAYEPETIALVESNPLIVDVMGMLGFEPVINHRAYASSCTVYTSQAVSAEVNGQTHLPLCIVHYEDFDLITVHAHRPLGRANIEENVEFFDQLVGIIEYYEENEMKFVIVGDFNATRYSIYFRERFGQYVQKNLYTWMTDTPLALPIDHVISNMDVDYVRSKDLGSDHRALLLQINE